MGPLFEAEKSILLWIQNNLRTDFLTPVMKFITHLADKGWFWLALTFALLVIRKTRKIGVVCLVSMTIGLIVTNLLVKNLVGRIRPYELIQELECLVGKETDFSFPSGHTTNSLACAWVLFKMAPKKWGIPALVLAILISLSRLYVGIHYPTDVLGGAVFGIGSACLALWLVPKLEEKYPKIKKIYEL